MVLQLQEISLMCLKMKKEAKQIASKRSQLMREQSVRTQRHITLDEMDVELR
jgi:hypothetical protein